MRARSCQASFRGYEHDSRSVTPTVSAVPACQWVNSSLARSDAVRVAILQAFSVGLPVAAYGVSFGVPVLAAALVAVVVGITNLLGRATPLADAPLTDPALPDAGRSDTSGGEAIRGRGDGGAVAGVPRVGVSPTA